MAYSYMGTNHPDEVLPPPARPRRGQSSSARSSQEESATTSNDVERAAGFTQEWAASSGERVERRQTEIQANATGNPAPVYRTVVSAAPDAPQVLEEERKH